MKDGQIFVSQRVHSVKFIYSLKSICLAYSMLKVLRTWLWTKADYILPFHEAQILVGDTDIIK